MWFLVRKNLKGKNLAKLFLVIFLMTLQVVLDIIIPLLMVSLNNGILANVEQYPNGQNYVNDLFFGHLTKSDLLGGSLINHTLIVGGILMGVFVGELLFGIFGAREATKLSVDIANEIRFNLFRKIQGLSFIDLDKFKTSSLITRLTVDIQSIQDSLISVIRIGFRAIMLYVGGIISSVIVISTSNSQNAWLIPVILVVSSIGLFGILSGILYYGAKYYKLSRYATDNTNSVMRENILGVRVVKSFNLQQQQIERFEKVNNKMRKITEKAYKIGMWMFPIVNFIINAVTVIVIWVGGLTDALDIAQAGPVMGITGMILMGMVLFINVILQLSIAIGSAKRIKEVHTSKPSISFKEDGVEIQQPSIEFKNVNFKYHEHSEYVLEDINLKINPNETVGIIGATGSGKTTLISLIARMYDVNEGQVLISNYDIKDIKEESLRKEMGVSTQQVVLFSGTIESNLKYGKEDATYDEMVEAAKGAQAYDFIMQKEAGFESVVEQRGRNFSGGQKQRLAITRALIRKPKILILDSSTSALDMITEKNVNEYIKNTNKDRTTIMISQRISGVKDADRIIVLEKGRIVGNGKHVELLKNCAVYNEIALSQLGKEGVENEIRHG